MSTSTVLTIIGSVIADTTTLGGVAITGILGIAVALMILGFFWFRLQRRAVKSKGF